jgi:hypothetical protein
MATAAEKPFDQEVSRWLAGAQHSSIRWSLRGREALPLVIYHQGAIKPLMHRYPGPGIAWSSDPRLDLQATAFETDHVVCSDSALMLEAKDLFRDEALWGRPVG